MSAAELTSAAADLVTAIATLGAVAVAGVGLKTWKKELKGRAEFETARSLAKDTYALREALGSFRSPLYLSSEFPEGEHSAEGYAAMFHARWQPVRDALVKFDSSVLEAEALWGQEVRDVTALLRTSAVVVLVASEAVVEDKRSGGRDFKADPAFGIRMRADLAGMPDSETNEMSKSIRAAVKGIEDFLKPHLSRN